MLAAVALVAAGALLDDVVWPNGSGGDGGGGGQDGAAFTEEEAGSWEGVSDSGTRFEAKTEAGEPAASLDAPEDDSCSTDIRLLEETEGGYLANVSFGGMEENPFSCVSNEEWGWSTDVDVTIEGNAMTIDFYSENSLSGERSSVESTLVLSRTG